MSQSPLPQENDPNASVGYANAPLISPTEHGQESPIWPYVVGGASVAVAANGLLTLLARLVEVGIYSIILGVGTGIRELRGWGGVVFISRLIPGVFLPIACGLLLAAAALLIRRKRLAVRVHMAYAILSILLVAGSSPMAIAGYVSQDMAGYIVVQGVIDAIWEATKLVIYPILVLVWFRRRRIRQETEQWGR